MTSRNHPSPAINNIQPHQAEPPDEAAAGRTLHDRSPTSQLAATILTCDLYRPYQTAVDINNLGRRIASLAAFINFVVVFNQEKIHMPAFDNSARYALRIPIDGGDFCPRCNHLTQRFTKSDKFKPKKGQVWYSQWDVCSNCGKVTYSADNLRHTPW